MFWIAEKLKRAGFFSNAMIPPDDFPFQFQNLQNGKFIDILTKIIGIDDKKLCDIPIKKLDCNKILTFFCQNHKKIIKNDECSLKK